MATIRRATEADAGTIHGLVVELAAAIGRTGKVASRVEDIRDQGFGADPAFEALIAECDGAAVGLCLFFESFSTWDGRRGVYVQDIYVAEAARGLGLGRRLLSEAAAISRTRGGSYLRLSVAAENDQAQAFYRRIGLSWSRDERIYQLRGDDFAALARDAEGVS
ncbi:MAG: GNAT family N-acetyltransferase [Proteobacteria bacterium]|nr:GNAT family N-acetyltransferase [Pseudomonadota bacterium]